MQAFPAAFLLDSAMAIPADGKVRPPWASLRDRSGVKDLVRRLAGPRKQDAAAEELLRFIGDGYVDRDFTLTAMVRYLPEETCVNHLMHANSCKNVSLAHVAIDCRHGSPARMGIWC